MAIIIDWDCDFDPLTYSCQPKYSFRRYLLLIYYGTYKAVPKNFACTKKKKKKKHFLFECQCL